MRLASHNGFGLVEVLVGAAVLTVFLLTLTGLFQRFLITSQASVNGAQAALLAEEGIEAMRHIRDRGYDSELASLADGTEYHLAYTDGLWQATTTPQTYFGADFARTVTVADVSRDSNDDITQSGGTNDPGTKRVTVEVTWSTPSGVSTKTLTTYFTDIHD